MPGAADGGAPDPTDAAFLRRVLIVAAVVILLLFLWTVREALLIAFAAIVFGVILDTLARPFRQRLGWGRQRALLAGGVLLLLLLAGVVLLVGTQIASQVSELGQALPQSFSEVRQQAETRLGIGAERLEQALSGALGQATALLGGIANAVSALVLAVVAGIFLAGKPDRYRDGLLRLAPDSARPRLEATMAFAGNGLRQWLIATTISMAIVGTLAGLGTWALGLPAPLALGITAGLAEFIPVVGTIVGALPAVLLAATEGGTTLLYTVALYVVIQQIESNMITPLVQRELVEIEPPILLFGVVAAGLVFGLPGLVLAAPLTVVATIAISKLYVRDTLGESTDVPGEEAPPGQADQP